MEALIGILLGGLLAFNSFATPKRAEKMIEASLRQMYPGATVNATVEGKKGRSVLKGRFRRVRLELEHLGVIKTLPVQSVTPNDAGSVGHVDQVEVLLRDFELEGIPIKEAELEVSDVDYDLNVARRDNRLSIVRSNTASMRLILSSAACQGIVRNKLRDFQFQDVRSSLKKGRITVTGNKRLPPLNIPVPFVFSAKLVPANGNEVRMTDERFSMERVTGFSLPVGAMTASLNPVYVIDPENKWPLKVQLNEINIIKGQMEIKAELTFIQSNKETDSAPVQPE